MKSSLEAPPDQVKAETGVKETRSAAPVIDTSKMSKGQREALELAEASRDPLDERGSFASNLFIGRFDYARIFPYPVQSDEDRAKGEPFLNQLREYLRTNVDADEIDPRSIGKPDQVWRMKIPQYPGFRGGGYPVQQIAPKAHKLGTGRLGRFDTATGQIPFDHQGDLDQHRVDIETRDGIGRVWRDRQHFG